MTLILTLVLCWLIVNEIALLLLLRGIDLGGENAKGNRDNQLDQENFAHQNYSGFTTTGCNYQANTTAKQ